MKNYTFTLYLLLFGILSSCSNDNNSLNADELSGSWVCTDGTYNGEKADLLIKDEKQMKAGAEITFKGNKFTFPILEDLGKNKEQEFEIKNNEIHCKNFKDLVFAIKDLTDKKMTLEFTLQGHNFSLIMEKTN